MAVILDGRRLSAEIREKTKASVDKLKSEGIDVGLGIILAGDNSASRQYYSAILKASKGAGIKTYEQVFDKDASINEVLNAVYQINHDERVNGLLVLFPLPRRMNSRRVVNAIIPEKDIDGLGAISVGRLAADESIFQIFSQDYLEGLHHVCSALSFLPCTPFGVIRLLEHYAIELKGKHAVVIGKSLAVGKPLALMLLAKEATVTVCHKSTDDLASFTRQADIICSATGVRGLIQGDMVKDGAVVVDIGIHVSEDGEITGDVDFQSVAEKTSYITPVPGGVGPVTIAMLLENAVKSAYHHAVLRSPFVFE